MGADGDQPSQARTLIAGGFAHRRVSPEIDTNANVLIASDGPRLKKERPTIFMGSRGVFNFTMTIKLRKGGHHSGNWGGLLANPGIILSHAISSLISASGEIKVSGLKPLKIPKSIKV